MRKLDMNFLAALTAVVFVACFIAVLHYTSFERHHTHDWPQEQSQTNQNGSNENDVVNNPLITDADRVKPFRPTNSSRNGNAYTSKESLQHDDHKAQILMAFFALLGLLIGAWGIYLLAKTMVATEKGAVAMNDALIEAKEATKAAWASVENGRAWIVHDDVEYTSIDVIDGSGQIIRTDLQLVFNWKNYGQTPAIGFCMLIDYTLVKRGADIPIVAMNYPTDSTLITVAPNQSKSSAPLVFSQDKLNKITSLRNDCYIFGKVWYKTIYGSEIKITEFCHQYLRTVPQINPITRVTSPAMNTMRPVGQNNSNT